MMRVVADTNVLVSALQVGGKPNRHAGRSSYTSSRSSVQPIGSQLHHAVHVHGLGPAAVGLVFVHGDPSLVLGHENDGLTMAMVL